MLRRSLRLVLVTTLALIIVTLAMRTSQAIAGQPTPPGGSDRMNLILLLADDLRADGLGCAGHPLVQTPHLDRMAGEGVYFLNSFVTDAICAPSRASILSGQYVRRHKIDDFAKTFTLEQWAATYPALLRQHGYRTGFIGKYGVGHRMPEGEFDYWRGFPGQGNFFEPGDPKHLTARMGDQALEFLEGLAPGDRFCLSISFKATHTQSEQPGGEYPVDPRDEELYARDHVPPPPTVGAEFFAALPPFLQNSEGRLRWERRRLDQDETYQECLRNYLRLTTGLDREVGRLREALAERGLAENTVIVFTSDNGYFLGGRGLVDKFFAYEESIRVPLIVYDPRAEAAARGQRREELVLNIDLAPTLLEYAGLAPPESMQGQSLVPLIQGKSPPWREDFFYEHHYAHGGNIPPSEAVRNARWKYVRYYAAEPVVEQLFDLQADPLERQNLAGDAAQRAQLETLRKRWQQLGAELR